MDGFGFGFHVDSKIHMMLSDLFHPLALALAHAGSAPLLVKVVSLSPMQAEEHTH